MKQISALSLLILICLTGCQSFESVKTVAKIGATFSDYTPINDDMVFLCNELNRIEEKTEFDCDKISKTRDSLNSGLGVMVAYCDALLLAVEDDEFKADDLVEQTVKAGQAAKFLAVNDNQISGIKTIASGIKDLLVAGAKQKALRKAILDRGSAVDTACTMMLEIIKEQKKLYGDSYKAGVNTRYNLELGFRGQVVAKPVGLHKDIRLLAYKYIHDQTVELNKMAKAVTAFQKGHKTLWESAQKFNIFKKKNDRQALKAIISSLKDVFDGIDEFSTPVTENDE
jgi:hypothetical protein